MGAVASEGLQWHSRFAALPCLQIADSLTSDAAERRYSEILDRMTPLSSGPVSASSRH